MLECIFYRTSAGAAPVREWLLGLEEPVRKVVGSDIERVQWKWPISMPLVGSFGEGLYEVRSRLDGNSYRVFFVVVGSEMVLLHGFQKKTQKTPDRDIALARARQKRVPGS